MARSPIKSINESDVTTPEEETVYFDEDTLKGEEKWSALDWLNLKFHNHF